MSGRVIARVAIIPIHPIMSIGSMLVVAACGGSDESDRATVAATAHEGSSSSGDLDGSWDGDESSNGGDASTTGASSASGMSAGDADSSGGGGQDTGTLDTGGPLPTEVCYPGQDGSGTTCVPVHSADQAGYVYPEPLEGDPTFRPPIAFIDLDEIDPNLWVAPNFQLFELAQPDKGRWAVLQPHAVASLQALRDAVGAIDVDVGYRSPQNNADVGGASYSRHIYGDAFDLDPLDAGPGALENACVANGGMLVPDGGTVHCDFRFAEPDPAFFGPG